MCHRKARKIMICISVALVILTAFVVYMLSQYKNDDNADITEVQAEAIDLDDFTSGIQAETFDLDEYKTYIHQFRIDYCVEAIDSAQTAAKAAIRMWEKKGGYVTGNYLPPQVFYDSTADCWLVMGSPPKEKGEENTILVYSIPIVIIQTDGTVLAFWLK